MAGDACTGIVVAPGGVLGIGDHAGGGIERNVSGSVVLRMTGFVPACIVVTVLATAVLDSTVSFGEVKVMGSGNIVPEGTAGGLSVTGSTAHAGIDTTIDMTGMSS